MNGEPIVRKVSELNPDTGFHVSQCAIAINQIADLLNGGLVLESESGQRFRLIVSDGGVVSVESL